MFNQTSLVAAIVAANARYIATNAAPVLNANGFSKILAKPLKIIQGFNEAQAAKLETLGQYFGTDYDRFIAARAGVYAVMRFGEFVDYCVTDDFKRVEATSWSGFAGAVMLSHNGVARIDNEVFRAIVTTKGTESSGDKMKGISVSTVRKLLGTVTAATAPTQLSLAFGMNGFVTGTGALSIVQNRPLIAQCDVSHPFSQFFVGLVNGLSAGKLDLIAEKGKVAGRKGSK